MRDEWLYLYVLLEFQSRPDHWMALRMQVYLGLLYQDLVKWKETPTSLALPPPVGIEVYQAAQRYVLVDLRAVSQRFGFQLNNLLGALAALAYSASSQQIQELAREFEQWLAEEGSVELRRAVELWLRTRLSESEARHTLEATPRMVIKEEQMADFRNGMPFF